MSDNVNALNNQEETKDGLTPKASNVWSELDDYFKLEQESLSSLALSDDKTSEKQEAPVIIQSKFTVAHQLKKLKDTQP